MPVTTRVADALSSLVEIRPGEGRITALMFAYAFSAMTAYNIVQPVTRSTFIIALGADNLPYVLLVTGFVIGVIMYVYTRLVAVLPRRSAVPSTQLALAAALVAFFVLLRTGGSAATVGFYVFGQIVGTLLLSQFWTLANELYDPRQARRLFGFIGGGVSLGGMAGSGLAALVAGRIGTAALLLVSAAALVGTAAVVIVIQRRPGSIDQAARTADGSPVPIAGDAWTLVRQSASLRSIALLISLAAIAAMIVGRRAPARDARSARGDPETPRYW